MPEMQVRAPWLAHTPLVSAMADSAWLTSPGVDLGCSAHQRPACLSMITAREGPVGAGRPELSASSQVAARAPPRWRQSSRRRHLNAWRLVSGPSVPSAPARERPTLASAAPGRPSRGPHPNLWALSRILN
jgi:hypothetical protein